MTNYSGTFRYWEGIQNDPAIAGAWGTPNSFNMALVEAAQGGTGGSVVVDLTGLTTKTLSTAQGAVDQSRPFLITFIGAIPAACTVTLPNVLRNQGFVQNLTTGGFNLFLSAGAGTTMGVPNDGFWYWYATDGATNVFPPTIGFGNGLATEAQIILYGGAPIQGSDSAGTNHQILFVGQGAPPAFTRLQSAGAGVAIAPSGNPATVLWQCSDTGIITQTGTNFSMVLDPTGSGNAVTVNQLNSSPARTGVLVNLLATTSFYETFTFGGIVRGSIQPITAGSATAYNTTSDAAMKIHRMEISGYQATRILKKLVPRWFNWKEAPDAPWVPGFFAQQVHRYWPWAVTKGHGRYGSKNYMPWQTDNSKLIPLLTAALQDALYRIERLEKRR